MPYWPRIARWGPPSPAHGQVARRRRYVRAVGAVLIALVGLLIAGVLEGWPLSVGFAGLVLVPAAALAEDRYRNLGHAVVADHLVTRSGALVRRRVMIESDGIVGWKMRQTFFQRRVGVMTLTAATAAGRQGYRVVDVDPR